MTTRLRTWPLVSSGTIQIHQDDIYRAYLDNQSPELLFRRAESYLEQARAAATRSGEDTEALLQAETEHMMIHAIFGSNRIESAGLGFEATKALCEPIWRQWVNGEPRRPDNFFDADPSLRTQPACSTTRGQQEVTQHMMAYLHMIQRFVINNEPMTEELIQNTHRTLCQDIPVLHREGPETPGSEYAGVYRTVIVGAGNTNFVVPGSVPRKMALLCRDLGEELRGGAGGPVDPFSLAAKYSLEFVMIHPFLDGNGRMCRILLNAILFRLVGVLVAVGEDDADTGEYMGIKRRASAAMEGHGEYATFVLGRSVKSLRRLKQKLNGKRG